MMPRSIMQPAFKTCHIWQVFSNIMDKNNHIRRLLIVPILHTKEDMGSLASGSFAYRPTEDDYLPMVSKFWEEIKERVKSYFDDFKGVKVYQDGLPNTDKRIVNKIISKVKSPNYQLLRFLKDKGAKIFGSEDPSLLEEEYNFISQILKTKDEKSKNEIKQAYEKRAPALLVERDAYIAERIDTTLDKGNLGILFIGAAHQIKDKLPKDIQTEIL